MTTHRRDDAGDQEGPVIRDRRRIDPDTGTVRESTEPEPSATPGAPGGGPAPPTTPPPGAIPRTAAAGSSGTTSAEPAAGDDTAKLKTQLVERTADVQRIQAEYANYRKRVERDRVAVREQALANVLGELVPVLDDIGRAREHEELTGGFKSVAESLESIAGKLGLERFGAKGDPFDPKVHEALTHSYSGEVTEPTCVEILQPGYSVAGRVLRAARVAVAEPAEPAAGQQAKPQDTSQQNRENPADAG